MKLFLKKASLKCAVLIFFLALSYNSFGTSQYATGPLTFSTTWSTDTVLIIGDITVNSGVTLTINPGTKVIFQGHYKFNVNGRLLAIGTVNNQIQFTINDTTGFSTMTSNNGGWYGVRFVNNVSTDTSKLFYCRFSYGKANGTGDDANGGAVCVNNFSRLKISNCTFEHNAAKTNGGAVYMRKSYAQVAFSDFSNNKSTGGGGLYVSSGAPAIYNNTFISNFANNGGGGVFFADTTLARANGNLIRHNMGLLGGGVGCYIANPLLNNNTIVYNKATHGGAMICINSSPTLKNNILYSNTATGIGPQVALMTDLCDPNFYYCNIQGGYAGFGIQGTQTYTGQYLNNLAVPPLFEDTVQHNYLIKYASPCLDAGTPDTTGLKLPAVDLAQKPRISMGRVDIGAYEREQVIGVCGNITQNTVWAADTVKLNCDITIGNGVTLTINPKVYVEAQGHYTITVNGRIVAQATSADSIIFTAKNHTTGWGGIIFYNTPVTNDSSKFSYCRFSYGKNAGMNRGSLMVVNFPKIKISNSLFAHNQAMNGGALYALNSSFSISKSAFYNNLANDKAGAVCCDSNANLKIVDCIIAYNQATNEAGGVYCKTAAPVVKSTILANNTAALGGALSCDTANAKIINCLIVNNTATSAGGLRISRSNPVLTNNTIAYNVSNTNGGGVLCARSMPVLTNNVLYNNTAVTSGSQVFINDSLSAPAFYYCDIAGDTTAMGYNGFTGFNGVYQNNIDTIPAFMAPPAGAGMAYPGLMADFAPDPCSHLYNRGKTDTSGLQLPAHDLAGNSRFFANRIDIGAYELIKPQIAGQPVSISVCAGDTAVFAVSVETSSPVSYLWQYSSTAGILWSNAPNVNNDSVYYINGVMTSQNNYLYRCIISAPCAQPITSQSGTLSVSTPPAISNQPGNVTICQGATASFTVTASGTNIAYQWQQLAPAGSWTNCSGASATQSTYTVTNTPANLNGYRYRCLLAGNCDPDTLTNEALLTVKTLPAIVTQPTNQSNCEGQNVTFTLTATGTNIALQWEESTDGGASWHNAPGASTTNVYSITGITASMSGYRYRCVVTGDCSPAATSNVVTLSVNTSPVITTQPVATHVCVTSDTSISVSATGGNLTYQWEKRAPADTAWSNATGPTAVSAAYQIDNANMMMNGTWFRCRIQNICPPPVISDSVQLFVHTLPAVYLGPDDTIWLYNESVVLDAGGGFSSYHWSTGENTQTITIVGLDVQIGPHMYTVTVTDGWGCSASDNITITVLDNTGITFTESETSITIYPNPAKDYLYVDMKNNLEPIGLRIVNTEGRTVMDFVVEPNTQQKILDFSEFAQGVYFITVTMNGKTLNRKIVKF